MNSFIDSFAITYYLEKVITIFQGQVPYINYSFEYPILALIPMFIALIPSVILKSQVIYLISFILLMVICDTITTICIYKISIKISGSPRQAFISAVLYATAISVAYVTITEYSAFATMLMMIGITYTIDRKETINGYIAVTMGFFTKIFPVIALPFIVLYNSKETSLKTETINGLKVLGIASLILFVPLFLINPANLDTYQFKINGGERGVYASSVSYMVFGWIHDVFNIAITQEMVSTVFRIILVGIIFVLLNIISKAKTKDPVLLLKLIMCAIFTTVVCMQFNSPNYWTWGIPLVCILCGTDIRKISLFVFTQIIAYIAFPLSFWSLWTNPGYTGAIGTPAWQLALILFTIQFIALSALVWILIEPKKLYALLRA